jgi:hypothetical protein
VATGRISKEWDLMTVELLPVAGQTAVGCGMTGRLIFGSAIEPRHQLAFVEWELTGAAWTDRHPYDEFDFILEGELHVQSGDDAVVGDLVRVEAGSKGSCFAPVYARRLSVYAHDREGADSTIGGLQQLSPD